MKTKYNITEINPQTIREVRQMINDSLSVIMEDSNLKFELGNATYDDNSFKFTGFRISLLDAPTEEQKALARELKHRRKSAYDIALDSSIIGKDSRNKEYKLVGFKPRARKKPFIIQDIKSGERYVCPESMAVTLFREVK